MALIPEVDACRVQANGIGDSENDVGNTISVQISGSEVETSRIEVNHLAVGCRGPT